MTDRRSLSLLRLRQRSAALHSHHGQVGRPLRALDHRLRRPSEAEQLLTVRRSPPLEPAPEHAGRERYERAAFGGELDDVPWHEHRLQGNHGVLADDR